MNFTADDIPDVIANGEPDECEFVARLITPGPAVRSLLRAADRARPIDRITDDEPLPRDLAWLDGWFDGAEPDDFDEPAATDGCCNVWPCRNPEGCPR